MNRGAGLPLVLVVLLLACGEDAHERPDSIPVEEMTEAERVRGGERVVAELGRYAAPDRTVYDPPPDLSRPPNATVWPPPPGARPETLLPPSPAPQTGAPRDTTPGSGQTPPDTAAAARDTAAPAADTAAPAADTAAADTAG